MQRPIVVVGSINMDLVLRTPRIPEPGETLMGTAFAMHPGGKGANQAVGVARLGYPVEMIGCVGHDEFGRSLCKQLRRDGVSTAAIGSVDDATGIATVMVDERGENRIVVVPGANHAVKPVFLRSRQSVIENAGLVLVQLEIPLDTVSFIADLCQHSGVPLILDPAPAQPLPSGMLSAATWITPNETEAEILTGGVLGPQEQAMKLNAAGARNIIFKRGSAGASFYVEGDLLRHISAPSVSVRDTTAAGDGFNAAFAVALARGKSVEDSVRFAVMAAAISVTRDGAQPSLPTLDEVEEAFARR